MSGKCMIKKVGHKLGSSFRYTEIDGWKIAFEILKILKRQGFKAIITEKLVQDEDYERMPPEAYIEVRWE